MGGVVERNCIFRLFGNHLGFHNALVTVQRKCSSHWVRWWVGCDPWYVVFCSVPSGTAASAQASYSSIAHCCHSCFCTRSSSDNSRISFLRRGRFTQRYVQFTGYIYKFIQWLVTKWMFRIRFSVGALGFFCVFFPEQTFLLTSESGNSNPCG
jgi:hypothetical protein